MVRLLFVFCWAFVAVMILMITVPYLRRQRDLLTTWTLFLLGSACFVGLSGIGTTRFPDRLVTNYTADYLWFFAGVITFYLTLWLTYKYFKWPRRAAGRHFRKWPKMSNPVLFVLMPLCLVMSLGLLFPPQVQGLGQIVANVGKYGSVYGTVFMLILWVRQPLNPLFICLLIGVSGYSFALSTVSGSGRREMVAVLAAFPTVLYWLKYRYTNRAKTLSVVLLLGFISVVLLNAYSTVRHNRDLRSLSTAAAMIQELPKHLTDSTGMAQMLGQDAVDASLLSIHVYRTDKWEGFEVSPFHTLFYILVNPIPRVFWENKPEALGTTLPRDTRKWSGGENWGPGIVGHGFHEGGLYVLVIYAFMVGTVLRFCDELLARQPNNPYLLGMLATCSGQIVAWPRGDIAVFTMQIISGVIAGFLLAAIARVFFGRGVTYQADQAV